MVGWYHRVNGPGFKQTLEEPGVLQSRGLERVRHELVTEEQQQW